MSQNGLLFAPEQFHMRKLQVYNWGTFSDLHSIDISEKGFLFIGPSGSGKSTLLDAFSALLIPNKWIDFNAAARENERRGKDRNLMTYVRGAYGAQQDEHTGEITTQFLRTGTNWSALALTYQTPSGKSVVLAQILWVRGNTNSPQDIRRLFLVLERPFDLLELQTFPQSDFNVRKLKEQLSDANIQSEFTPYRERFCRLLGIENENALRLLHKTQSAKNLGDLNTFLREFMLDKPETFDIAERLVNEFGELNEAHQAIVTAREQIQTLSPAQEHYQQRELLLTQHHECESLLNALESYYKDRTIDLLGQHLSGLDTEITARKGELSHAEQLCTHHRTLWLDLQNQHRQAGGEQLELWEKEKNLLINEREKCIKHRDKFSAICQSLDKAMPDSPQGFAALQDYARQQLNDTEKSHQAINQEKQTLIIEQNRLEKHFKETGLEIKALEQQPSNIPAHMLALRQDIAQALCISESDIPFIGELIDVKPEANAWQGAVERVLHGFALSLLVSEEHYAALSSYVNQTHLGQRLVYYRMENEQAVQTPSSSTLLVHKLIFKPGKYHGWLLNRICQQFDYDCVENMNDFREKNKAITQEGQVKHSRIRHEKDDRRNISDKRHWVLGFDNHEKLALYKKQAHDLSVELSLVMKSLADIDQEERLHHKRRADYEKVAEFEWSDIDISPLLLRINTLENQIQQAKQNNQLLQDLGVRIKEQETVYYQAEQKVQQIKAQLIVAEKNYHDTQAKINHLEQSTLPAYSEQQEQQLNTRFHQENATISLDNIASTVRKVQTALHKDLSECTSKISHLQNTIENHFADFKRRWPAESSDMDTSIYSAPHFFAMLQRIEDDGLPQYEHKFFDLLQKQSHQNLSSLSTHLQNARREILERMDQVNESLSQVPFNQQSHKRTFLKITASDRHLAEVKSFRQAIQSALSYAFDEDKEHAENRFLLIKQIVEQLAGQTPEQKRWRETVLDVRLHIEFIGQELDENGEEVELYQSGGGKSGGQRQKLTAACLAAALRYQLGSNNEYGVPIYAPIILDEAFDKADNEFTALAMNIFKNFGFQMLVATPLKSVLTLSPFIGGACYVSIQDRKISSILPIEYLEEEQRLNLPQETL